MPRLLRILAGFREGRLDLAQLHAQVKALLTEPGVDVAQAIEVLQAEQRRAPLPAAAFTAILRQLQSASDRTLLRSRDAALAFILGDVSEPTDAAPTRRAANVEPPKFSRTLINRFGLVELAGEGGMSRVYKAVDLRMVEAGSDDPHIAVKVLNIPFEDVNDAMALLHREMRNLQSLVHPNIVRVFDCDRDGDTVFMTMEYLAGSTLNARMRAAGFASLDRAVALPIVAGMAQALEFAHGKRIVHGDLKPGNVMITASGEVKVIDFGIARVIADPVKAFIGRSVGAAERVTGVTPAYASPQLLENRGADPRDDVFSLACIAWELLAGSHPFGRKEATVARNEGIKLERSARLSVREYRALAHGLEFDRDKRTASARQFIEELTGVKRRSRSVVIGGSAVAALACVVAGLVYFSLPEVAPPPAATAAPFTISERAPEPAPVELSVGTVFRDCPTCPLMIVLPPGDLAQGSPTDTAQTPFETPQHDVFIEYSFAASQHEVTVSEFAEFVEATGRATGGCWVYDGTWQFNADVTWKNAVEWQTALHPVSCVSWDDASAYVQWLTQVTGKPYRLPSSAEWELAARGGSAAERPWSSDAAACAEANVADQTAERRYPGWTIHGCMDTYVQAAPVGSFAANAFGLHDTLGNVFEWVADCWHDDYSGAPDDGSARLDGNCSQHELRGGSWFTAPAFVRASYRSRFDVGYRSNSVGFRIARNVSE